jgi:RNA-binding protein
MRRKKEGGEKLNLTPSKKELMNRSLSTITINIGKSGINGNVIDEIKRQLKDREVVKIRFSKGISTYKQNYISDIIEKSNSKLVDFRGNVAILFKKKRGA